MGDLPLPAELSEVITLKSDWAFNAKNKGVYLCLPVITVAPAVPVESPVDPVGAVGGDPAGHVPERGVALCRSAAKLSVSHGRREYSGRRRDGGPVPLFRGGRGGAGHLACGRLSL